MSRSPPALRWAPWRGRTVHRAACSTDRLLFVGLYVAIFLAMLMPETIWERPARLALAGRLGRRGCRSRTDESRSRDRAGVVSVVRVIYENPLAYVLGLEGLGLLRSFTGEFDRD